MRTLLTLALASPLLLTSCVSMTPAERPDWTQQATRSLDNGYIVYLGIGEAPTLEQAQVMSEGQALEDLANECSMIPRGTRIEDRFTENGYQSTKVFVKVAVDFQECDAAMRTNDPNEIKKIANVAFTQQLKRYQDLRETGVLEARQDTQISEPQVEMTVSSEPDPFWADPSRFYETRQYVVYQKEIVVLSPPTSYAPSSPENKRFTSLIAPATKQIQLLQEKQPTIRALPWSHLPEPVHVDRPHVLSHSPYPILPNHAPIPTARPQPYAQPMPITRPMGFGGHPMPTTKPTAATPVMPTTRPTMPTPNFVRPSLPSGPIGTRPAPSTFAPTPAPFHPHYTAPSMPVAVPVTPTHSAPGPHKSSSTTTSTSDKKTP